MNLFLDTNILVDFLTNRPPFTEEAQEVFELAESGQLKLYTSTHAVVTTHYLLKKYEDESKLRYRLSVLTELVEVLDVSQSILKKALKSTHKDFEDAVQIRTAESISSMGYIITRNIKDFKASNIPAISIREMISRLEKSS